MSAPRKYDNPLRKIRSCLSCQNEFISEGPSNRVCRKCKEKPRLSEKGMLKAITSNGRSLTAR